MMATIRVLLGFVFLGWAGGVTLQAQSLHGHSGLILTPTAIMAPDGHVTFGMHHMNGETLPQSINFFQLPGTYNRRIYYARVGFLPFLELTVRVTRYEDFPRTQAIGDRFIGIRLRLLRERDYYPAVVIGGNDIYGTRLYHSLYAVASKTIFTSDKLIQRLCTHLGYASTHLKARYYFLKGIFGGLDVAISENITLLFEHDSRYYNGGVKLSIWQQRIHLIGGFQRMAKPYGGISYTIAL